MTDIPQEWVEAAQRAIDAANGKRARHGKSPSYAEWSGMIAQAALAAVIPLVRADAERERDRYREALTAVAPALNTAMSEMHDLHSDHPSYKEVFVAWEQARCALEKESYDG